MNKINLDDIKYLTFQGGGGKGIVYLGAVKALEKKLGLPSIIDITVNLDDDEKRPIKGISGASAGAITAFLIALGMSSTEVENEIRAFREKDSGQGHGEDIINGRYSIVGNEGRNILGLTGINSAEGFLDSPNGFNRTVEKSRRIYPYETIKKGFNIENYLVDPVREFLIDSEEIIIDSAIQRIFYPVTNQGKKIDSINTAKITGSYVHNLLYHRGIFSGLKIRYFFKYIIKKYLIDKHSTYQKKNYDYDFPKPENITFYDFYKFTGVDLVITGTNISQQRPLYFSAYHTPDFPVIEAVAISMNIPIVFKPIYVNYEVDKNKDKSYNDFYTGLWGDGGMLNNFPLHAFNLLKNKKIEFKGQTISKKMAANLYNSDIDFNKKTIGFTLGDNVSNDKAKPPTFNEVFPTNPDENLLTYFGQLFRTFMFSGSEGRIRNKDEAQYSIELDSEGVGILDFAHPDQDLARIKVLEKLYSKFRKSSDRLKIQLVMGELGIRAKNKAQRISDAEKKTNDLIN